MSTVSTCASNCFLSSCVHPLIVYINVYTNHQHLLTDKHTVFDRWRLLKSSKDIGPSGPPIPIPFGLLISQVISSSQQEKNTDPKVRKHVLYNGGKNVLIRSTPKSMRMASREQKKKAWTLDYLLFFFCSWRKPQDCFQVFRGIQMQRPSLKEKKEKKMQRSSVIVLKATENA